MDMRFKQFWRRGLSLLLAVLMVVSMLPPTAYVQTTAAVPNKKIYFDPGCWNVDGAKFHAWVWGGSVPGGGAWYEATYSDGTYSITIPADATGMKWLRKNPNDAGFNWNCWNQTGDLTIGSNNKCTITDWGSASMSMVKDTYSVTYALTGLTHNGAAKATAGSNYAVTLTASAGYTRPGSVTVTVGGTTLTSGTHYTYSSGVITIKAQYVTGAIKITATGGHASYSVTHTLTGLTASGGSSATHGTNYVSTLTAKDGYKIPDSVTVKIGGAATSSFTYSGGVVTVTGSAITGNIEIIADGSVNAFTVTYSGSNYTKPSNTAAVAGKDYTATLVPSAGYDLPDSITVTVGGATISGYTYEKTTGKLTIPADKVTGNITVSVTPVIKTYTVTFSGSNYTENGAATVTYNTAYTATLTPAAGYALPASITVQVGGTTISGYTYSASTGELTIPADKVAGNISISVTPTKKTYAVTYYGKDYLVPSNRTATHGEAYIATLTAKSGYSLPASVTVTIGGKASTDFTYNAATGELRVDASAVTGEIAVTATGYKKYYVAGNAELCGSTWDENDPANEMTHNPDGTYTLTFTGVPAGNHALKVTDGTWTNAWGGLGADGNYEFSAEVKSSVTVTFNATTKEVKVTVTPMVSKHTVTFDCTNVSASGAGDVYQGVAYTATLTADKFYKLHAAITVKVDGATLSADKYTYDSTTGAISIPAAAVTGNITITAAGEKLQYYVLGDEKLTGTDWTKAEANKMAEGSNHIYTITYTDLPAGSYEMKVLDTADNWYPENNYVINMDTYGSVTVTFNAATGEISYTQTAGTVNVTINGTNVTSDGAKTVTAGKDYTATLSAASGYGLPATVTVTVGGQSITDFTYDRATGKITIPGSAVQGDIQITAKGATSYSATYSGTHATVTGPATFYNDVELVVTVTPESGYVLPAAVTVKVGSTTLTAEQYTFDRSVGKVTIPAEYLTGNVQVSAEGEKAAYYIAGDEGITGHPDWTVSEDNRLTDNGDGTYSITYLRVPAGADGYYDIKVVDNGDNWYSGSNDPENTSNYRLFMDYLGDVTIRFTPNSTQGIITYTVTPLTFEVAFSGTSITFKGAETAVTSENYTAVLELQPGYVLPASITVTVDGKTLTSGVTYDSKTGAVTIDKSKLTGDVQIKADAVAQRYIIAGTTGLCGSSWDNTDLNNCMTANADGTFTIVYDVVGAGTHEFKVTKDGQWLWPTDNYALNLSTTSRVTIHYNPATNSGSVETVPVSVKEKYDRMDVVDLSNDSVFYADVDLVDFLNNNRAITNAVEGYYTDNQGEWVGPTDEVYSYLNYLIAQQVITADYSYPLYFGPLNYIHNRYSRLVGSDERLSLGNWSSAANVAFGTTDGGIDTAGVAQGLVGGKLDKDGNLTDPKNSESLLYFNKTAAREWTNNGHRVMAYYENLKFPFKKTYDADTRVTTYSYDSASDYAVYYDYENNQMYASNTYVMDLEDKKGFYPLNEPDDKDNEVNNGFGAKFSIDFTVGDKGVLANGEPVTFAFTGDDDVFVFIDGVLVLDMGGAHAKVNGNIDFSTLTATVYKAADVKDSYLITSGNTFDPGIYGGKGYPNWLYNDSTEERATPGTSTKSKTFEQLGLEFDYDQVHTMTVFYMERGMFSSNFSMEFTMVPVPSGMTISKELNGKEINKGLLGEVSNAEDFDFELSATSPSNTSVAFHHYSITDKYTGEVTLKNASGTASGRTYSALITGVTNHAYAHSFVTAAGEDAFIPGTSFTVTETTNGIFRYDSTTWAVYDAKNGYTPVKKSEGNSTSAVFTMGTAGSNVAQSYAVTFTNNMQLGSLNIGKVFDDSVLGDTAFRFYVYLDLDGEGATFTEKLYSGLVYTVGGVEYTCADGIVTLTGGQTAVIAGIPAGATYRVEEIIPDDAAWYQADAVNATGTIAKGIAAEATFTNKVKTESADKVIFVEAGTATGYTVAVDGKTVTVTGITPVAGLKATVNGSSLSITGEEANRAYTAAYEGRYPDGTIVTGQLTVYTFAATNKTYVFDFGLASDLAATTDMGDGLFQGGSFFNDHISGVTATLAALTGKGNSQTAITATEGSSIHADGSSAPVIFRPVAFMSQVETYTYTVQITAPGATFKAGDPETGCTVTGSIQVMPASSVYYEDNFNVTGGDPAQKIIFGGGASGQTAVPDLMQSNQQHTNYGYDPCYNDGYRYSANSAVTLDAMQYAHFTFTGTGFDLISRTAATSAGLAVYVFAGGHQESYIDYLTNFESTEVPEEMVFVNNYYNNGDLYQVPVVSVRLGGTARTYSVYIQCLPTAYATSVELDAVRIYDPMDDTGSYLESEQNTGIDELRVLFKDGVVTMAGNSPDIGIFVGLGKGSIIEKMVGDKYTTAMDLKNVYLHGPNNEMYLPEMFGIHLCYTVKADEAFSLQLGAKAVGSAKRVGVYARAEGGAYEKVGTLDLNSATDMYYDLTAMLSDYDAAGATYDLVFISKSPDDTNQFVSLTTVKHSGVTLTG